MRVVTTIPKSEVILNQAIGMIQLGIIPTCAQDVINSLNAEWGRDKHKHIEVEDTGVVIDATMNSDGSLTIIQDTSTDGLKKVLEVLTSKGLHLGLNDIRGTEISTSYKSNN